MPTLFDDEEYFVPPPKKESRKKKEEPEAKETALNAAETDAAADPVVPSEPVAEAGTQPVMEEAVAETPAAEQPVADMIAAAGNDTAPEPEANTIPAEAITEDVPGPAIIPVAEVAEAVPVTGTEAPAETTEVAATESVTAPEVAEAIEPVVPAAEEPESNVTGEAPAETIEVVVNASVPEQEVIAAQILANESHEPTMAEALTDAPEEEGFDAPEIVTEQSIVLEQENVEAENSVVDPFQEIVEVSAVDELTVELPKAVPGITFEIPEEDETRPARHEAPHRQDSGAAAGLGCGDILSGGYWCCFCFGRDAERTVYVVSTSKPCSVVKLLIGEPRMWRELTFLPGPLLRVAAKSPLQDYAE